MKIIFIILFVLAAASNAPHTETPEAPIIAVQICETEAEVEEAIADQEPYSITEYNVDTKQYKSRSWENKRKIKKNG